MADEEKTKREQPVRAVYESGVVVALVQSRSDDAAIRTATNGRFAARIVNGRELADLAKQFEVQDEAPKGK